MSIDYRRLVVGLSAAAEMIVDGRAGIAAVEILIATAREATGAGGATFTEYGDAGGRIVIAGGSMVWALGQLVAPEMLDPVGPVSASPERVDLLPPEVAEPLLARGVVALAGSAVRTGTTVWGAVHLFFGEVHIDRWEEVQAVLRLVAQAAQHIYAPPGMVKPGPLVVDDDDRTLFLAVAGHELRTPVTVVKGYASMLADRWDSLDETTRREAARVLTQRADDLARLVDRLLGASVGDGTAGWLVRMVPFDPIEALRRAAGELPAELRRTLRLELPTSLPMACGDPAILTSIVAELVTNAVRYTPQAAGPGSSAAPVWKVAPASAPPASVELLAGADAHTVYIKVCDRGIGIDPTQVERAFERFWRARRDGDGRTGVGLGLYLVRRLVERQNGWVSLRPREGGGTIAEVRLPRADVRTPRP